MWRSKTRDTAWRGVILVAITYVYFLIFAQFAFLSRLASLGIAGAHLKSVMAAMALGGIALSLLTPRMQLLESPALRMRMGLGMSGVAAFLSLLPLNTAAGAAVALLIGAGLGLLTVTLVTHLRQWMGDHDALMKTGLGTGIGYFICNVPPFFAATAETQAIAAGLLCAAGIGLVPRDADARETEVDRVPARIAFAFLLALAGFTALVWLDSAAFYIIQNTVALKSETWLGAAQLWRNGVLHLGAALCSAWLLRRWGTGVVLPAAFAALGGACLLLLNPAQSVSASILYPVGVSLYSVALVAYPSLLAPAASAAERARRAGWIYAIAGWLGSALGIGMGQHLGHVPRAFVAVAGVAVLLPWIIQIIRKRTREAAVTAAVLLAALGLEYLHPANHEETPLSQVERGRRVYISEGCINCHSQYVRPDTADVLMWGPVESLTAIHQEQPPLIGNRRQGPDLAEVGGRRSQLWLKAHLFDPAEVSGASIMPSYGFLFQDERGDDLVAYLASLREPGTGQHIVAEKSWHPSATAVAEASADEGRQLYRQFCATCHAQDGKTRARWLNSFRQRPTDLDKGPYQYVSQSAAAAPLDLQLAQIAKFGIAGTDMPGHEYLSDTQIASLSLWLRENMARPGRIHN